MILQQPARSPAHYSTRADLFHLRSVEPEVGFCPFPRLAGSASANPVARSRVEENDLASFSARSPLERSNALQTVFDIAAVLFAFLFVSVTGIGFAFAVAVALFVRIP